MADPFIPLQHTPRALTRHLDCPEINCVHQHECSRNWNCEIKMRRRVREQQEKEKAMLPTAPIDLKKLAGAAASKLFPTMGALRNAFIEVVMPELEKAYLAGRTEATSDATDTFKGARAILIAEITDLRQQLSSHEKSAWE